MKAFKPPMWIFDGHLDLAMNAVMYNRDITRPLAELRAYEKEIAGPRDGRHRGDGRGTALVTLDQMQRGQVRCCTATIFTRARPGAAASDGFLRSQEDSCCPDIAAALAHAQWAYYQMLERRGWLRIVRRPEDWLDPVASPVIQCLLLVECADMIGSVEELDQWHRLGVRAVGLTHIAQGRCGWGNGQDGPLSPLGLLLLEAMARRGMVLDVSHLADTAMGQALELYAGPVMASHSNCRALVPGMRQITDAQIRTIASRGGVVGVALSAAMLCARVQREGSERAPVTLSHVAEHLDHICQVVGDARHAGIGSDLDGGFGQEHVPKEIESIADLARIGQALAARGYGDADIAAILHGNWLAFWQKVIQ